jgi:hypothetical protein
MNNQGGIAPFEQDLDEEMGAPGSPAPSLYSFHSSLDGRVMVLYISHVTLATL